MTTRWKGRNRSSSKVSQQERIQELECRLALKEESITDLEKKLAEQLLTVKKLRRERDELRNKNASLVGKLAEVSRKNSVASSTPPGLPRILKRVSTSALPTLPPTPGSPSLPNGTVNNHTPDTPLKNGSKSDISKESLTEESDTDYSDLEEDSKPTSQEHTTCAQAEGKKMEATNEDSIDKEVNAVLRTAVANSIAPGMNRFPQATTTTKGRPVVGGATKWNQPASSSPVLPRQRNRNSSNSSTTSTCSSNEGREGSYQISKTSNSKLKKIQSSEKLASHIRQMLPKHEGRKSVDESANGTASNGTASNGTAANGTMAKEVSVSSLTDGNARHVGPIQITAGSVTKGVVSSGYRPHVSIREDSISSEGYTTTDMESSLDVFSPVQSPANTLEPAILDPSSLKGVLKSLPNLVSEKSLRSNSMGAVMLSKAKRVQLLESVPSINDDSEIGDLEDDQVSDMPSFETNNVRSRTQTLSALTGGKRRMEIGRKKIKEHRKEMRRMSSISTAQGMNLPGPEHPYKDRKSMVKELELLSPLLQAKIRNMTLKRLYAEYGGKDVVTKAVCVIEEAYRTYTLRKRWNERLKEKRENRTLQRKRAMSLRPTRRPSIMAKERQRRYTRGKGVKDPMVKTKEAVERLAKERMPHAHSGSRLELMEKRRSEGNLRIESLGEEPQQVELKKKKKATEKRKPMVSALSVSQIELDGMEGDEEEDEITTPLTSTPLETQAQEIVFTLTGVREEHEDVIEEGVAGGVAKTKSQDKPDGIIESESSNSLLLSACTHRLSIFSTTSVESSPGLYPMEEKARALTLPRMNHQEMKKEVDLKLKTGIHYFNKKPTKGIQYLIRNKLLEDEPRMVADFLIHQSGLSKEKIGEFLGSISSEFNMAVLESMVECSNMGEKPIDEALREFQKMFRMPGEAQKIDKIMEVFAMEYYKHNKVGVFKSEDGAYILSFAIMMLHTSLHNPSVKSRTTKKQWVSMNRGTNDGENFPETFLLEIFDRIQATEFATGTDHTHIVAELEKQITGSHLQKLSTPQRFLVLRMSANEVTELQARPGFRTRHRRTYFFFNDIAVVCKRRHSNEYVFKDSFSLLNVLPVKFETHYYKHGVQLHAMDRDTPYQFNCDTSADREQLLQQLDTITMHLKLLEKERIAELGTTLTSAQTPDLVAEGGRGQERLLSGAGDLISSMSLAITGSPTHSPANKRRDHFVPGVGDILITSSLPVDFNRTNITENRISRDSGFDSQQLTPTPPLSPALTDSDTILAASPSPYITPTISPATSQNTLTPSAPPPRSKSSEGLKQILVNDSSSSPLANRSPSMDFLKRRKSTPTTSTISTNSNSPLLGVSLSPKAKKKEERHHKKTGLFKRSKKDKKNGSVSPQSHRKLQQTLSSSLDVESSVEASSPGVSATVS